MFIFNIMERTFIVMKVLKMILMPQKVQGNLMKRTINTCICGIYRMKNSVILICRKWIQDFNNSYCQMRSWGIILRLKK